MLKIYLTSMVAVWLIGHFGINNRYKSKFISNIALTAIFIIIFVISGFRSTSSIGDTSSYAHSFKLLVAGDESKLGRDLGFGYMMLFLTKISVNPQILLIVTSFITNLFIILTLYKYSEPFETGIFLYFATVIFYVTMNGIRQSFAAAILFWGIRYVISRDWKKYFILVLIASSIHVSALILVPVYFLCKNEAWSKSFYITILLSLVLITGFKSFLGVFVNILEGMNFSGYSDDILKGGSAVNFLRVAVSFVPVLLAYIVRKPLKENWKDSDVFINMSLFNAIFMLFSTRYLYFYRVCIYFELSNLILIPRMICCFDKKQSRALYVYVMVLYSIFCWYQVNLWSDHYVNILFR